MYRFHLNGDRQKGDADCLFSAFESGTRGGASEEETVFFQDVFNSFSHFAIMSMLQQGMALDLTITVNWFYEMEPLLPTMGHRNF